MNYIESINYIHQTPKFARELGNSMLKKLLSCLGNPEKNLKFIHIAGTNGKGSTAIMLSRVLSLAGYRCGLFISPYIERFNERISIDGVQIPDESLAEIITEIKETIERNDTPVSEFALDTAAAFCWFDKCKCEVVVLETGLGGRLDATNVIKNPIVTVLTSIGLDHTKYLGDTIEKIAMEKCGIIKEKCPVVCYPKQETEALKVIKEQAMRKGSELYIADEPVFNNDKILYNNVQYELGLSGRFQGYNGATVLETINVLRENEFIISEDNVKAGLKSAKNPARFERLGNIILDGSHNLPAAKSMCESLKKLNMPIYFCVAMMEDKDYSAYVKELSSIAKGVITTEISMPRCLKATRLKKEFKKYNIPVKAEENPQKAINELLNMAKGGIVCVCGSLYFAGEIRPWLRSL